MKDHPLATDHLLALLNETGAIVDTVLADRVAQIPAYARDAVGYALAPKGTRERALLVRLGWELGLPDFRRIAAAGASIELLHFSSLVVDDVLDDSPLRGGAPTVRAKYGDAMAVAIGELLWAESVSALSSLYPGVVHDADMIHRAMVTLQMAHRAIYLGQFADLRYEKQDEISEQDYFDMVSDTTGALMQASAVLGAQLRGASESELAALARYGHKLGIALQVRDDVAEIIGEADLIGKEIGGDIRRGKKRLPLLLTMERVAADDRRWLVEVMHSRRPNEAEVGAILQLVRDCGATDVCLSRVATFCQEAVEALEELPGGPATVAMRELAHVVADVW